MTEEGKGQPEGACKEGDLVDIADKMLAQLEREYLECQGQNIKGEVECPEEEIDPQGYEIIGEGGQGPQMMSDDEEEQQNIEGDEVVQKEDDKNKQKVDEKLDKDKDLQGLGQLIEVFPCEQWVAPQREVNIDSEKIKALSMNMNLPIPDWMKSDDLLRNRIFELFGEKGK